MKDARLVRDKITGASRGFCFVEFHSEEHATHTLRNTRDLRLDGVPVKISYARDGFRPERAGVCSVCCFVLTYAQLLLI